MPIAPISRRLRRPIFSTKYRPGKVEATLTQLARPSGAAGRSQMLGDNLLGNNGDDERVLEAGILEVLSAIVEDEIDASELL